MTNVITFPGSPLPSFRERVATCTTRECLASCARTFKAVTPSLSIAELADYKQLLALAQLRVAMLEAL